MKVTIDEIKRKFEELISEKISREEISNWAEERMKAEEKRNLEFVPSRDESKIWEAIIYLSGADLKVSEVKYFHVIEDFIEKREELDL